MPFKNYQETIEFLFAQLPMFSRVGPAAYKADLANTIRLCNFLDNPERKFKSIHIAGTNGKGSCSHMLASILHCQGYKVGLYTSPHVVDFKERIKLNGKEVDEVWLVAFVNKVESFILEWHPSFFEVCVAMAFSYFAEKSVDIAIIEVGLGGLLDSTNVILPELSIITNISLDHTNLLGDTLAEIAMQKAGIVKHLVPVIIGESQAELENIFFTVAIKAEAPIYYADQIFDIVQVTKQSGFQEIKVINRSSLEILNLKLDLTGQYQLKNIKTVLTAIEVLRMQQWQIDSNSLYDGLLQVKYYTGIKGRFDKVADQPSIILDVAHNQAGLMEVISQVKELNARKLHIVIGFVKDKDIDLALDCLPIEASYYFTQASIPRALPAKELQEIANQKNLHGSAYSDVLSAFKFARSNANQDDLVLVTGSFFILADIYNLLDDEKHS